MTKKRLTLEAIAERIDGLKNHLNDKFDENFKAHEQMSCSIAETNGRVKKLELWRSFILGGIAISTSLLGGVWTIFTFLIK